MKKNILTTSLLLFSIFSNSQTSQVSASKKMIHPTFSDTTAANAAGARVTANVLLTTNNGGINYRFNNRWRLLNDSSLFASKFTVDTGRNNRLSAIATVVASDAGKVPLSGIGTGTVSVTGSVTAGAGSSPAGFYWGSGTGNGLDIVNPSGQTTQGMTFKLLHATGGAFSWYMGNSATMRMRISNGSGGGLLIIPAGGTTELADSKAAMDIRSTTQGVLLPRMTTTQRDAITSPPTGLIIYNTTTNKLNVYTTVWEQVTSI